MQIVRSYITNSNSYVISLIKIVFLAMEQLQCKQSTCDLGMKVISWVFSLFVRTSIKSNT